MTSGEGRDHEGHDHDLKPNLLAFLVIIAVGLVAGIVLSYVQAQHTGQRLAVLEEYVQGKGVERDAENARLREQIRQAQCDLLDQLPEGGLLDRPRAKYGCGPGIPLADLTPQEQAQVQNEPSASTPARPAIPSSPPKPSPAPSSPAPSAAPERTGPAPAAPSPSPAPGPQSALCGLLPLVCSRSVP